MYRTNSLVAAIFAVIISVISYSTAFAGDYDVPVIIDGKTYTITVTVEDSAVVTATSAVTSAVIGPIVDLNPIEEVTSTVGLSATHVYSETGSGDAVIVIDDLDPEKDYIALVVGNDDGRYMSLTSHVGDRSDLLINTQDVYDGILLLDVPFERRMGPVESIILELKNKGFWNIIVMEASAATVISPGQSYESYGDEVVILDGVRTLSIVGNAGERYMSAVSYEANGSSDLLINTQDAYDGTVLVDRDAVYLQIKAKGDWSVSAE